MCSSISSPLGELSSCIIYTVIPVNKLKIFLTQSIQPLPWAWRVDFCTLHIFLYFKSHAESHDMAAVFSKCLNYESPMFPVTWFVSKFNLMICQNLHKDPANTKRWINVGLLLTLNQHWFNVSWLLGTYHRPFKYRVLSSPFWIVLYFKAGITDAISILFWQLGIPILLLIKLLILIINFLLEDSNK